MDGYTLQKGKRRGDGHMEEEVRELCFVRVFRGSLAGLKKKKFHHLL